MRRRIRGGLREGGKEGKMEEGGGGRGCLLARPPSLPPLPFAERLGTMEEGEEGKEDDAEQATTTHPSDLGEEEEE